MRRRTLLKSGGAALFGPLLVGAPLIQATSSYTNPLHSLFYERGLVDGVVFAETSLELGMSAEAIDDPALTWSRGLLPKLRTSPVSVGGLTSEQTFFCFDLLSRSFGMRVSYRMDHIADGGIRWHVPCGEVACSVPLDLRAGLHWQSAAAAALLAASRAAPAPVPPILGPSMGQPRQDLVSWIISPRVS